MGNIQQLCRGAAYRLKNKTKAGLNCYLCFSSELFHYNHCTWRKFGNILGGGTPDPAEYF
jgi:hypothetical protein